MKTYISKPIEVKAELFNPDRIEEYRKMGAEIEIVPTEFGKNYILLTLENENGRGKVYLSECSYLVCGTKGEFYPCRKDIFEEKYFSKEPMEKEDEGIEKLKKNSRFNIGLNYIFLRNIKIKKNTGVKQENVLNNYKKF